MQTLKIQDFTEHKLDGGLYRLELKGRGNGYNITITPTFFGSYNIKFYKNNNVVLFSEVTDLQDPIDVVNNFLSLWSSKH